MKVYCVFESWPWEGDILVAVLASKEEAEALAEKRQKSATTERFSVEEWTVGEVRD